MSKTLVVTPTSDTFEALVVPSSPARPLDVYLSGYAREKTRSTMRESLERCARAAKLSLEAIPWHQLTYVHTAAIRAALYETYHPHTAALSLTALRGILHTCARLGLMTYEAYHKVIDWPRPPRGSRLPAGRDLSSLELAALRAYCVAHGGAYGSFLRAVFAFLLGAGLRETETCGVLLENLDLETGSVRLVGKGSKEAVSVLGIDDVLDVGSWLATRAALHVPGPFVLARIGYNGVLTRTQLTPSTLVHLCRRTASAAGIAPFSPHDCRRTFCTRMLEAGVDLATVQRLMRHDDPKTTMRYDKRQAEIDAAKRREVKLWG